MILSTIFCGFAFITLGFAQSHGAEYSETMGPVAFMWPPDREWGAAQDNTPPCGSAAGVTNRTQFPLVNGQIALVAQDESWTLSVAISYSNNPTTLNDFRTVIDSFRIPEIDDGHTCFPLANPNATDNIRSGSNATLQISYTSDMEEHHNQTFYACADITYVQPEQFTYQVPCFNATDQNFTIIDSNSTQATNAANSNSTNASHKLSGGAIAGIVIGALVGVLALIGALFFIWRQKQQLGRLRNQQASTRTVKWEENSSADGASRNSGTDGNGQDIMLSELRK